MKIQITKKEFWSLAIIGCWLLIFSQTNAQTAPEFLVSWRTVNYVPPGFQGKILPSRSSLIEIGFDLVDNNKIVNFSNHQIKWFLNNKLLQSGVGLKTVRFNSQRADNLIRIRVEDYRGRSVSKILTILTARPEVLINSRIPDKNINLGNYTLEVLPYFFNVSDLAELSFRWSVNNRLIRGANSSLFNLNLESEGSPITTDLTVSATISNNLNPLEVGRKIIKLTVVSK